MTDKQQTLREAFEAWCLNESGEYTPDDFGIDKDGVSYKYADVQTIWKAWQAAARWADK